VAHEVVTVVAARVVVQEALEEMPAGAVVSEAVLVANKRIQGG
jgi:hypothetical protein